MQVAAWPAKAEIVHLAPLFHRGNLDQPAYPSHGDSHEGPCLSCAPDRESSDAWLSIARLGGYPLWTLAKPGGFRLLDMHRVNEKAMATAAVTHGLLTPCEVFRVTWHDSELDARVRSEFATIEEARAEVEEGRRLARRKGFAATPALVAYWGSRRGASKISPLTSVDAATVAFADLHCPALDGVLWRERLDVAAYSAPRVALFQRILPSVSRKRFATASA